MEIILKEDVKGLGYKNDIVEVRPGYGRNFLIPRGMAIEATPSAKKVVAEDVKQAAHKAEKIKTEAVALAAKLAELSIELKAKVGESGKIFGAVTTLQLSDALKEKGYAVDRKRISFKGEVKEVGQYLAVLDLHKEVKQEIKFSVVGE
ncbi:MAG: 50S ribosomal protein L9 [Cytophagaceae bacterium]|jgi:large subunit ribosomal protein L9|nr:50S ribosomal protein L9 [Cytophagaceae bacterium]